MKFVEWSVELSVSLFSVQSLLGRSRLSTPTSLEIKSNLE